MLALRKVGVVQQLKVTAQPSAKDNFINPFVQQVDLPATFLPGKIINWLISA